MAHKEIQTSLVSSASLKWNPLRRSKRQAVVLALATVLLFAAGVDAQYMGSFGINYNNPIAASVSNSTWSNWIVYQTQVRQQKGQAAATGSAAPAPTSATTPAPPQAALGFHPTGTRLTTNKLADMIGHSPQEKTQVATLLTVIFDEFDKQAVRYGKQNDLSLAIGYFLGQNTTIYHGQPDPKDEEFVELSETVNYAFGNNAELRNLTNQQKQELYEMLVGFAGLTYASYQDALKRNDQANIQGCRRLAGINLKSITHVDPAKINFTAQGLSIKP